MLSESQERMLLVAEKGREQEVFRVFEKWGLDAVEVGRVTSDGKMRVLQHGEVVAEIPNEALTDDAPVYKRPLERWEPPVPREMPEHIKLAETCDLTAQSQAAAGQPEHLRQALGLAAVRSHGADQHGRGPGRGRCGSDPHQGIAARAGDGARRQRTLVLSRSATGRDACRRGSRAQRGVRGRDSGRRRPIA